MSLSVDFRRYIFFESLSNLTKNTSFANIYDFLGVELLRKRWPEFQNAGCSLREYFPRGSTLYGKPKMCWLQRQLIRLNEKRLRERFNT